MGVATHAHDGARKRLGPGVIRRIAVKRVSLRGGFADGLHAAVEFDQAGAHAVAEHAGVGFLAEPGHGRGLSDGVCNRA